MSIFEYIEEAQKNVRREGYEEGKRVGTIKEVVRAGSKGEKCEFVCRDDGERKIKWLVREMYCHGDASLLKYTKI